MDIAYVKHDYALTGKDYVEVENYGVNYSTDERVVGTGLDGKPVYEKTLTTPDSTESPRYFFVPSADAKNIEIVSGYIDVGSSTIAPLNLWFELESRTFAFAIGSTLVVGVLGWTPQAFKITVRYQKTE